MNSDSFLNKELQNVVTSQNQEQSQQSYEDALPKQATLSNQKSRNMAYQPEYFSFSNLEKEDINSIQHESLR